MVLGIAGAGDMKKVGRVGGKALLYFEVVSTIALVIGLIVVNLVRPGAGFNVDAAALDARAVADYARPRDDADHRRIRPAHHPDARSSTRSPDPATCCRCCSWRCSSATP